jgi:hypothetical protein
VFADGGRMIWKASLIGAGVAVLGFGCAVSPTTDGSLPVGLQEPAEPDPDAPNGPDTELPDEPDAEVPDEPPEPRQFSIAASGDLLIHRGVRSQAAAYGEHSGEEFDFRPMFEQVQPIFEAADLSICHLEVPLSADNTGLSGYPLFLAPRELADAIHDAGFDGCSTASNHSMDQGGTGATETLDLLDDAGVAHAGMARTEQEAEVATTYVINDVEVAHLSYTYGLNGMPLPEDKPWMVDLIDDEQILRDVGRARDDGAEFVVASMHWGNEYQQEPTAEQRELAEVMLVDGGVDLILGHHAHVVQPIERIGDRYAVYGLGNFLSNQSASCCLPETQDGVIVVIDVEETDRGELRTTGVSYVPTWVDRDDFTIVDVGASLDDPELPDDRRDTLETSWDRTVSAITAAESEDHDLDVLPLTGDG